jgi:zinc and cadmium transporter
MKVFLSIILSTFFISLLAFSGIVFLFLKEELLKKLLLILVSFSAGALIGGAFIYLIPEAVQEIGAQESQLLSVFLYLLLGFCGFFALEQFIRWHHHHIPQRQKVMPFSYLIFISDSIHNFIDGLIIAASFVVSFPIGLATSLIVALHEIPQEIGDFGVLVYGGFKKIKALVLNFLSGAIAMIGGIVGFFLSEGLGESVVFLLSFAAGSFIYIACSDLIPEIKDKADPQKSFIHFFVFLAGLALIVILRLTTPFS